ncbi:hypothetical protein [Musicola paradisiaca]|nr:hypothetical protein [Musicola paradisiaca]
MVLNIAIIARMAGYLRNGGANGGVFALLTGGGSILWCDDECDCTT